MLCENYEASEDQWRKVLLVVDCNRWLLWVQVIDRIRGCDHDRGSSRFRGGGVAGAPAEDKRTGASVVSPRNCAKTTPPETAHDATQSRGGRIRAGKKKDIRI